MSPSPDGAPFAGAVLGLGTGFMSMWLPILIDWEAFLAGVAVTTLVIVAGVIRMFVANSTRPFWLGFCVGVPVGALLWFALLVYALSRVGS